MSEIVLGIDLGTTYSVCAILDGKEPVIIPNQEGKNKTPSIVAFKSKDEILVGELAKRQSTINPQNTIFSIKRFIGKKFSEVEEYTSSFPFKIRGGDEDEILIETEFATYTPEEISSNILLKIKNDAETYLGQKVKKTILTVPAYFNNLQREKTKLAAEMAGLEVLRLINEPTAASLAYSYSKSDAEVVAVYDFGGGTFDLTLLNLSRTTFEVVATGGDTFLGGDDIDEAILQLISKEFLQETGYDLRQNHSALIRLKEACEQAKCELSQLSETDITLPFIASKDNSPLHLHYNLKSESLKELLTPIIKKSLAITEEVLSSANMRMENIDRVILAGGTTRNPLVVKEGENFFNKKTFRGLNPDEIVARGAVIQGGILTGSLAEILLLDVTPVNLGVETVNDQFSIIIEKNSTVPTRKSKIFTTTHDNQALVPIHILQGKSRVASENISLGYYTLSEIPPLKKGEPRIEVSFAIDADGILEVMAEEQKSGASLKVHLSPTLDQAEDTMETKTTMVNEDTNPTLSSSLSSGKVPNPDSAPEESEVSPAPKEEPKETSSEEEKESVESSDVVPFEGETNSKKLVDVYLSQEKYPKACTLLNMIHEENKEALPYVLEKYQQIAEKWEEKPAEFYQKKAFFHKLQGDLYECAICLEKARQLDKNNSAVLEQLLTVYHQIIEENPQAHEIKLKLGKLYFETKNINSAITYLQRASFSSDLQHEACKYLGRAFFEKKLYYIALQQFKKCRVDEEIKESLYQLNRAFEDEGQYMNAVNALENILAEDINYRDALQEHHRLKKAAHYERTQIDETPTPFSSELNNYSSANSNFLGNRFVQLKEINRGSMGVVYEAYDTALEEKVVLKILANTLAQDAEALKRFKREAKATRKLTHPNIVRIYDFGEINRIKYISMEYINGKDMKSILRSHGPLPEKKVLFYAKQICMALQYAHEKGIIHRDIKPANILITKEQVIKVSDFGIAKSTRGGTEVTKIGEIVGTPLYMSPEQITSHEIDFRADVYSLGVLLYEMISGKPPFLQGDITFHHLNTTPSPPKYCSPQMETVIMKCLQKKLSLRYQAVSEVLKDLISISSDTQF